MLQQLVIHNIALIENICIEFGKGLNILTGETGAGKSIIIDSLGAILGERLSKDLIRTGKEKATVEAVFQVENEKFSDLFEEMGIEPEEDSALIVSREFTTAGKNICRVNGKLATVSMLKKVGERMVDVHGQYDNQSLLKVDSHIELLDSFAGEQFIMLRQLYQEQLAGYKNIKSKLKSLSGDKNERERKIDLLKYQIDEIRKAGLKVGEEEKLNQQRIVLGSSDKILQVLIRTYELLYSGSLAKSTASDNINEAVSEMGHIVKLDPKYSELAKKLEDLSYQLEDVADEVRREKDAIEFNPELLEQVEERIDLIYKLKRKYGNSVKEVLEYGDKIEKELDELVESGEIVNDLRGQLAKINDKLYDTSIKMHEERLKSARMLESKITAELDDLEMKRSQFKVSIEFDDAYDAESDRKYTQKGLDKVEFLISPNVGEPLKPLHKIASGGEMSRIMLAIKTILAGVDEIPTLIFDEIDAGISGRASQKVGEKLSFISRNHQVLCVTHHAQIASMADEHYLIEKIAGEEDTRTQVKKLTEKETKKEIARILSGANISDITLKHAEELVENAKKFKNS